MHLEIDKLSQLVSQQFPEFFREEAANFVAFIQAYYEYLEQEDKLNYELRNLQSYRDISTTTNEFIEYFRKTLLPSIPADIVADKKILARYIRDLNVSRGTFAAYKFLFRILYNESVEINYPVDQVLRVSDGDWRLDRYLIISYDGRAYSYIGRTIKGLSSGAEALVQDVVRRVVKGRDLIQIIVSNIRGSFRHEERISLKSDINAEGFAPEIEAGINRVEIISPGGAYAPGDIVNLLSEKNGDYGKIVVSETEDLGGVIQFNLVDGGSGFTSSAGTTKVEVFGGDGQEQASFTVGLGDIGDTFAISQCVTTFVSNTVYGESGPIVSLNDDPSHQMSQFANVVIGATSLGFPEEGEEVGNDPYHDHELAVLTINNTQAINAGNKLYGSTSGANCEVVSVIDATLGATKAKINGYRNFTSGETITITTTSGLSVGTCTSFDGNTVGKHQLSFGATNQNTNPIVAGLEIRGGSSGAFGVIKKVDTPISQGYTEDGGATHDFFTVMLSANSTASLVPGMFDTGPIRPFEEDEILYKVDDGTQVGIADLGTSNNVYESVYTSLRESILFKNTYFGTIQKLSNINGGTGYSVPPTVRLYDTDIGALGIGEQYITIQSDSQYWGTDTSIKNQTIGIVNISSDGSVWTIQTDTAHKLESGFGVRISGTLEYDGYYIVDSKNSETEYTISSTTIYSSDNTGLSIPIYANLDPNDRAAQTTTLASGDIKGTLGGSLIEKVQYANGTYESVIRVWQDFNQRDPDNITFNTGEPIELRIYNEAFIPSYDIDTRTVMAYGEAKIVNIQDEGVLGKNAEVKAKVGADGTVTGIRILDSGFGYTDNEEMLIGTSGRNNNVQSYVRVKLDGVANSEGYYATTRSQVSTQRGIIQDGEFYQEYSYELSSSISLDRYRDIILNICHPSGQALFGKYTLSTSVGLDLQTDARNMRYIDGPGTISTLPHSSALTGSGTSFLSDFDVGDEIRLYTSLPLKTNLIEYSEDFSQWTGSGISLSSGLISPYGNTDATRIKSTGTNAFSRVDYNVSASGTVTYSVFVKQESETNDSVVIRINGTGVGGSGTNCTYSFNFSSKVFTRITTTNGTDADYFGYIDYSNGWYRLYLTVDTTSVTGVAIYPAWNITTEYGNVGIWGVQLEEFDYASDYIPTEGTTGFRPAQSNVAIIKRINNIISDTQLEIADVWEYGTMSNLSYKTSIKFNPNATGPN